MELWVVLAIIAAIALLLIAMYNRLVTLRQRVREAWSDIDVQLKRRYDLIPNLVETVKGYAAHEKTVFENVTNARANAISAGASGSPEQRAQALAHHLVIVAQEHPDRHTPKITACWRSPAPALGPAPSGTAIPGTICRPFLKLYAQRIPGLT